MGAFGYLRTSDARAAALADVAARQCAAGRHMAGCPHRPRLSPSGWAMYDANGFPLIYPGPGGLPYRDGEPLSTEDFIRMTNPNWVAKARAEHLAETQADRDERWTAWLSVDRDPEDYRTDDNGED